jgi:hypothetical protein
LVAKIARTEPWTEVSFIGPNAGITSVSALWNFGGLGLVCKAGSRGRRLDSALDGRSIRRGCFGHDVLGVVKGIATDRKNCDEKNEKRRLSVRVHDAERWN